ncbi:MAG TPA: ATP-binding protein [Phycisphaerae bacterium]|nr:ATP-binding protein [Phycisphaerae bacterium]HNU44139.1 ATP-binding protein [Phycisphaerae bacterium]
MMSGILEADLDRFYRLLCEHAGVALIGTNPELRIRIWNVAAARMFGAAAERMLGTAAISVVPQERREQARQLLQRALEAGESGELEFQYRDSQGARRELSGTTTPIVSETGMPIGVAICVRDITNRIRLADQLHESGKMAALGQMAGAFAHHFNNILGGIITSVDFAEASDSPLTKSRILEQVSRSLTRATGLLSSLLAFAEGDQRDEDLSDFTEIINGLADQFDAVARKNGIDLVVDLPRLPVLAVPRIQVMTILRNVVQNAIDAMPDGGTLLIRVVQEAEWIVTRVTDTGCGVAEADLPRIFEPFWSRKTIGPPGSGTPALGLGLAVAHGLLQMIGGTIAATSEVGRGSCFEIRIPADAANRIPAPPVG